MVTASPPTACRSVSENGPSAHCPANTLRPDCVDEADVNVQAAAGRVRKGLGHEARAEAVTSRDRLYRALQQHGVIAGKFRARDMVKVDLELPGREFLERRPGRDVLRRADRVELREEGVDVLDVLHAPVLRSVLGLAGCRECGRPSGDGRSASASSR